MNRKDAEFIHAAQLRAVADAIEAAISGLSKQRDAEYEQLVRSTVSRLIMLGFAVGLLKAGANEDLDAFVDTFSTMLAAQIMSGYEVKPVDAFLAAQRIGAAHRTGAN